MLLNNGVSPTTGKRLLSSATVDEMFRNQLTDTPKFRTTVCLRRRARARVSIRWILRASTTANAPRMGFLVHDLTECDGSI